MKKRQLIITYLLLGQLMACGDDNSNAFCDNHADIHQQHVDKVTRVNVVYSENGELTAKLSVPMSDAAETALGENSNIIKITAESSCEVISPKIVNGEDYWQSEYKFECGANNKLQHVSIEVLNNFPEIQEVEAHIKTPATNKNFILNRRCDRPIFVL
ncbi:MAG: hypothetical protein ABJK37_08120 [Paraglaciecola sp.]|uniref:hypothetical protein n=1 Tax=Paraglaciecola sp. TaxID=1920173 RepID=UPI003296E92E